MTDNEHPLDHATRALARRLARMLMVLSEPEAAPIDPAVWWDTRQDQTFRPEAYREEDRAAMEKAWRERDKYPWHEAPAQTRKPDDDAPAIEAMSEEGAPEPDISWVNTLDDVKSLQRSALKWHDRATRAERRLGVTQAVLSARARECAIREDNERRLVKEREVLSEQVAQLRIALREAESRAVAVKREPSADLVQRGHERYREARELRCIVGGTCPGCTGTDLDHDDGCEVEAREVEARRDARREEDGE